jgi:hypothetical protein
MSVERETRSSALSADTSAEAEHLMFEHYGRLAPHEKIRIMCELGDLVEHSALRGIRERHPGADEHEVRLRLFALRHGADLARRVFGWDPEVEGW